MYTNTRPSSPPIVTFLQMQQQLKIDSVDEQTYITDLVEACTEYAEQALDASLLTRTITATFDEHPGVLDAIGQTFGGHTRQLFLPRGPVQSITSVTDANGNPVQYRFNRIGNTDFIVPLSTFNHPLTVTYLAGYGSNVTDVPADIRMAIRTHVASLWAVREAITTNPMTAVPFSLQAFYNLRRRSAQVA